MVAQINSGFDRITSRLKGWRTVVFNIVSTIMPIISLTEFRDVLPQSWWAWYALIVTVGNIYLRYRTTSPIGKKL